MDESRAWIQVFQTENDNDARSPFPYREKPGRIKGCRGSFREYENADCYSDPTPFSPDSDSGHKNYFKKHSI